jgi:3-hydroxyacyl-[acyl-carrier-protein] dehydratase
MKFNLLDKIESIEDDRIVAVKQVSLAEEYLADHFPAFPVLPGVMMLEAGVQAAGWLLHHRSGFARSMVALKEAKNVKYGHFVAPGNQLRITAEVVRLDERGGLFKLNGQVGGQTAVGGRVELSYFNLNERSPELAALDAPLAEHNRRRYAILCLGMQNP